MPKNSKNKVYGTYLVYNSAKTLGLSLSTIVSYVDKVIIVDGAFEDYPHEYPQSTDRTKEIAEEICGDKLIWVDCNTKNGEFISWIGQVAKRNAYLKLVPTNAWFYVMDADVILAGDVEQAFQFLRKSTWQGCVLVRMMNLFPILKKGLNSYGAPSFHRWLLNDIEEGEVKTLTEKQWFEDLWWTGRYNVVSCIHRKLGGMQYKGHHSTIYTKGGKLMCFPKHASTPILKDVVSVNLKFLSSVEELMNSMKFKVVRREKFRRFRKEP